MTTSPDGERPARPGGPPPTAPGGETVADPAAASQAAEGRRPAPPDCEPLTSAASGPATTPGGEPPTTVPRTPQPAGSAAAAPPAGGESAEPAGDAPRAPQSPFSATPPSSEPTAAPGDEPAAPAPGGQPSAAYYGTPPTVGPWTSPTGADTTPPSIGATAASSGGAPQATVGGWPPVAGHGGPPPAVPAAGGGQPVGPWAAPAPWPALPYGVQPPPAVAGVAVVALVFAIVFFPVGLILGIVALARVVESRERGKGLAVAAIVVAGLQIVGLASFFSYVALNDDRRSDRAGVEEARSGPSAEAPGREISVFDLTVGDCFSAGTGLDSVTDVTVLSCADPHESEMFAAFDVDQYGDFGLTYPGEEALFDVAEVGCAEALPGYVLDVWAIPLEVSWFYYYPEEVGWRYGDREVLCYLGDVNGGELTGGPLRGDEAALTPRALEYLEVTAAVEALITREPLEDASVDDQRAWAGQMADALAREADALEAGSWYGEMSRLVDDLVAARRESLDHWRAAAEATARADLDTLVEFGYSTLGVEIEVEIRRLLDLDLGGW